MDGEGRPKLLLLSFGIRRRAKGLGSATMRGEITRSRSQQKLVAGDSGRGLARGVGPEGCLEGSPNSDGRGREEWKPAGGDEDKGAWK